MKPIQYNYMDTLITSGREGLYLYGTFKKIYYKLTASLLIKKINKKSEKKKNLQLNLPVTFIPYEQLIRPLLNSSK